MLGFFSYCSFEQTSMLWVSTYLVSSKSFSEGSAAAAAGLPCISVLWGFRDRAFLEAHGATRFATEPEDILGELG